ncbi:MAG: hypothetical protein AVDCRST_MAG93-8035, partial [uncultured Chloroflexia bacterium]
CVPGCKQKQQRLSPLLLFEIVGGTWSLSLAQPASKSRPVA